MFKEVITSKTLFIDNTSNKDTNWEVTSLKYVPPNDISEEDAQLENISSEIAGQRNITPK